jgi:hypothetical protein
LQNDDLYRWIDIGHAGYSDKQHSWQGFSRSNCEKYRMSAVGFVSVHPSIPCIFQYNLICEKSAFLVQI